MKANQTQTVKVTYADGRHAACDSIAEARALIMAEWPAAFECDHWDMAGPDRERLLFWATEEDSLNDDGQNAVATIVTDNPPSEGED